MPHQLCPFSDGSQTLKMDDGSFTINLTKLKNLSFLIFYFSMIFVGLMMPSDGNHGIFTPKSLSFLGSIFFFAILVFSSKKMSLYLLKTWIFTSFLMSFLLLWLFIGFAENFSHPTAPFDQFKIFLITISFVIMTLYAYDAGLVKAENLIKTMIFVNFGYSCLKLILIILHVLNFINMFALMETMGMRFMSMEMASGFSRFQTSVDIVTPFFILFVMQSDALNLNFTKRFKYFYCLISSISILFSFSRFLMAVAACSALFYWLTLNKKALLKGIFIFCALFAAFILIIGVDNFITIIERRFFSNDNYYSDLTRTQQIEALMEQFYISPYFGMGLGGYVKDFLRDTSIVYSYEVQWIAFLMQFGLFGMIFLLVPVLFICFQFLKPPITRVNLSFLGLFLVWLMSGFTNPFLISLASGIIYSIFLLAARLLRSPPIIFDKRDHREKMRERKEKGNNLYLRL